MTLLMHKIYSHEVELGSDTSNKGSSSDCGSGHKEEVAESDGEEDDTTPTLVVTEADNGREIQDFEYGCE